MKKVIISFTAIIIFITTAYSQKPVNRLSLAEVIQLAKEQSPQAILAKHKFRASYWQYRSYKADYLPSIKMTTSPLGYNRSLLADLQGDGSYKYVEVNKNTSSLGFEMSQNIGLTGGRVFVNTSLDRNDDFKRDSSSYKSVPYQIGFVQPIFGYNELRWNKKIEPIKYEEAKRIYLQMVENISMDASRLFFDLILAQQNLKTAKLNYANSDTLYKIAKGRYNIGTIAENELLQMQLSFLNAKGSVSDAEVDIQLKKAKIKSFLGLNDEYDLELSIPESTPATNVKYDEVLSFAKTNTPKALEFTRQIIEADRDVAKARSERGFSADLSVNYGINRDAELIKETYSNYNDLQTVNFKISVPILDWGKGKGQVKMAQSNREVIRATVNQELIDFEQDIFLKVMQFNRQDDQVALSAKADTISQSRYNVTKERFLIGKIDVLDLNIAQTERDAAKQKYINTLSSFWQFYYNMRRLTLFDFEKQKPLEMDFELLLK
ncbi:MAG: TolC family protein [Bacteroidales bacterium]|nr:MAG: TolC family protein [Bacteroidales bacterium]